MYLSLVSPPYAGSFLNKSDRRKKEKEKEKEKEKSGEKEFSFEFSSPFLPLYSFISFDGTVFYSQSHCPSPPSRNRQHA